MDPWCDIWHGETETRPAIAFGITSGPRGADHCSGAGGFNQGIAQTTPATMHRPDREIGMPCRFLPDKLSSTETAVAIVPQAIVVAHIMRSQAAAFRGLA